MYGDILGVSLGSVETIGSLHEKDNTQDHPEPSDLSELFGYRIESFCDLNDFVLLFNRGDC